MVNLRKLIFKNKMNVLKKGVNFYEQEFRENGKLTREQLDNLNADRRKKIVEFAFENIPFYRDKYSAAGFDLKCMQDSNFFENLPILEKDEIREHTAQIILPGLSFNDLKESTTGGSTGIPLRTFKDPQIPLDVISWRTLNWWGVDISESAGYLYRAIPSPKKQLIQKAILYPTKRNWIAAAEMTNDQMNTFYHKLKKDKTTYLVGYVGAIDAFASFIKSTGNKIESLKAIWTTSSPLTEGKRRHLELVFGCPVYTQYGSCEFYWIAAECAHKSGLHIANDIRHIDVVDGNKPVPNGTFGDLLITDLIDYTFPLIRYRIGDRGRLLENNCSCSLPYPLMDYVKGRISDSIQMPSGRVIPGEYWTTIFDDFTSEIKSFQVHQLKNYHINVYYEPNAGVAYDSVIQKVNERLLRQIEGEVGLDFVMRTLNTNDNGKTRFVVSEVRLK